MFLVQCLPKNVYVFYFLCSTLNILYIVFLLIVHRYSLYYDNVMLHIDLYDNPVHSPMNIDLQNLNQM